MKLVASMEQFPSLSWSMTAVIPLQITNRKASTHCLGAWKIILDREMLWDKEDKQTFLQEPRWTSLWVIEVKRRDNFTVMLGRLSIFWIFLHCGRAMFLREISPTVLPEAPKKFCLHLSMVWFLSMPIINSFIQK